MIKVYYYLNFVDTVNNKKLVYYKYVIRFGKIDIISDLLMKGNKRFRPKRGLYRSFNVCTNPSLGLEFYQNLRWFEIEKEEFIRWTKLAKKNESLL